MQAAQVLAKEHRNIERLIKVLEQALSKFQQGEMVDPQVFIKSGSFITKYMDQKHHGKEEKIFYALMEDYGFDRNKEPLRTFWIEHDQARSYTRSLRRAAFEIEQGKKEAKSEVVNQVRAFIDLLTHHIRNEDNNLFPMAYAKFSEKTHEELARRFEEFDKNFPEEPLLKTLEELEQAA